MGSVRVYVPDQIDTKALKSRLYDIADMNGATTKHGGSIAELLIAVSSGESLVMPRQMIKLLAGGGIRTVVLTVLRQIYDEAGGQWRDVAEQSPSHLPSDLETSRDETVAIMDLFLDRVYHFYCYSEDNYLEWWVKGDIELMGGAIYDALKQDALAQGLQRKPFLANEAWLAWCEKWWSRWLEKPNAWERLSKDTIARLQSQAVDPDTGMLK